MVDPESVRKLCRADLRASDLPDDTIKLKVYVGPAVAELLRLDPDAASRAGGDADHVASALNHLVAARVLPTVPMPTKEDYGDGGGVTVQPINVEKRVAELRDAAQDEIALVLDEQPPTGAGTLPAFIVVH